MLIHNHHDLIALFNDLFSLEKATVLVDGADEPIYLPKNNHCAINQIIFREDYFSSALHEIAHWCIAGKKRRELIDYGYWYEPAGRSKKNQQLFENAETKPQALEWIFSVAAGIKFTVSADNLASQPLSNDIFKLKIYQQTEKYLTHGLPSRAEKFKNQLLKFYQREQQFDSELFKLEFL